MSDVIEFLLEYTDTVTVSKCKNGYNITHDDYGLIATIKIDGRVSKTVFADIDALTKKETIIDEDIKFKISKLLDAVNANRADKLSNVDFLRVCIIRGLKSIEQDLQGPHK